MSWRYLEDVAIADVAFDADAPTLPALFSEAVDATLGVMVEDPESIRPDVTRHAALDDTSLDLLLFQLLAEVVYYKDADGLLARCRRASIDGGPGAWHLEAELAGERIDAARHRLLLDVKAVTMHMLAVERTAGGWRARVVVDV